MGASVAPLWGFPYAAGCFRPDPEKRRSGSRIVVEEGPVHDDPKAVPPAAPDSPPVVYDEEPAEHVPGSFLSALPQFFVFPLILVGTLLAVYIGLRWVIVDEPDSARELLTDMRAAGAHSRWQVAQQLAEGLQRGTLDLGDVPATELSSLYVTMLPPVGEPVPEEVEEEVVLMRQYLLSVLAHKADPALTRHAVEALGSEQQPVRLAALMALAQMGDPAAEPHLSRHLAGSDVHEERFVTIGALAMVGTPAALDTLAGLLGGDDSLDHRNAVLSLAARGDDRASPWLMDMLSRDSYGTDPALDPPQADLLDAESRALARAHTVDAFLEHSARAAGKLGDPDAVPHLRRLGRDDPSLKVQSAAINALYELGASLETDDGDV